MYVGVKKKKICCCLDVPYLTTFKHYLISPYFVFSLSISLCFFSAFSLSLTHTHIHTRASRSQLYSKLLTKVPSPVKTAAEEPSIDIDSDSDISVMEFDPTTGTHEAPSSTTMGASSSSSSSSSASNEDNNGPKIQIKLRVGNEEAKPVMMAVKRPFSALKTTWCVSQGYSEVCVFV
jgi:hypothetical protein